MVKFIVIFLLMFGQNISAQRVVNDFNLLNVNGKQISLKSFPKAKGFIIVFTCNHCPFAKLYPQRLNELNKKYASLGVPLIAISSTDTIQFEEDCYVKMVKKAKIEKFNFPYLYDGTQAVALNFNAERTPHAFVIWKENGAWVVKYQGAIDDNGAEPKKVKNQFIADAVNALLSGSEVVLKESRSVGCEIHFRGRKSMKS